MTFGFSRDDATKFLNDYYAKGIFESDPFAPVDQEGVGELRRLQLPKQNQLDQTSHLVSVVNTEEIHKRLSSAITSV